MVPEETLTQQVYSHAPGLFMFRRHFDVWKKSFDDNFRVVLLLLFVQCPGLTMCKSVIYSSVLTEGV